MFAILWACSNILGCALAFAGPLYCGDPWHPAAGALLADLRYVAGVATPAAIKDIVSQKKYKSRSTALSPDNMKAVGSAAGDAAVAPRNVPVASAPAPAAGKSAGAADATVQASSSTANPAPAAK